MYTETIHALADQAATKVKFQRHSLTSHFIRSALAGMYVGAAIALIFTVGGTVIGDSPGMVKLLMGVCFGGALTFVIFSGSELFTGSNLVLTLGVLTRKASMGELMSNWIVTWLGNLAGAAFLAVLVAATGLFDADPVRAFVLKITQTKMNLPATQLILRAVLANWLVCLGVWMAARAKEEVAKILLIWWCMFTFITSGYEHSIANMFGLMLGLFVSGGSVSGIGWEGYFYNIILATFGNVIGGVFFVGGMYWLGSPKAREIRALEKSDLATMEVASIRKGA